MVILALYQIFIVFYYPDYERANIAYDMRGLTKEDRERAIRVGFKHVMSKV